MPALSAGPMLHSLRPPFQYRYMTADVATVLVAVDVVPVPEAGAEMGAPVPSVTRRKAMVEEGEEPGSVPAAQRS